MPIILSLILLASIILQAVSLGIDLSAMIGAREHDMIQKTGWLLFLVYMILR